MVALAVRIDQRLRPASIHHPYGSLGKVQCKAFGIFQMISSRLLSVLWRPSIAVAVDSRGHSSITRDVLVIIYPAFVVDCHVIPI